MRLPSLRVKPAAIEIQHMAVLVGGFLILFVLGRTAFGLTVRHQEAVASAENQTRNVASVVADSTRRALGAIDLSLQEVGDIRSRLDDGRMTRPDAFDALKAVVKSSPSLSSVGWTDERGNLLASSIAMDVSQNIADQPQFSAQVESDRGVFIGRPSRSRVTGEFVAHVSRRISDPSGAFAGIAVGAINPLDLTRIFSGIDIGRTQVLTIAYTDGTILSRAPVSSERVGRSIAHSPLFSQNLIAAPSGSFRAPFSHDGQWRIAGYKQIEGFSLVVIASVEQDEALAHWRIQATRWLIMIGLVCIVVSVGVWIIYRQAARQAAQSRALVAAHASASAARALAEKARDEASAASRAKSVFLSNMSHELRTPLNAVLGFAEMLELNRDRNLTNRQLEALGYIRTGGTHLLNLVTEILDLSRVEAGRLTLALEDVAVFETLTEAKAVMDPIAAKKGIALSIPQTVAGATVRADPQRLRQVLLNLLSNAIKYNRTGGTVEVSAQALADDRVRIIVEDTGIGLPEGAEHKLFEPFQRLGAERSAIDGAGIGLALTKYLIEAMGGTLTFSSKAGVGSKFWFDLPARCLE